MRTMPTAARTLLPVLAAATLLAGCTVQEPPTTGTPGSGTAASATAGPTGATGSVTPAPSAGEGVAGPEEEAVERALAAYHGAVASGDFALACTLMTVESQTALVGAVQGAGGQVAVCPEALAAVLAQPGAADAAIEASNSVVVDDVSVNGLTATVTWTSQRQGVPRTDSLTLQSIDGQWRLAGPA